MIAFEFGPAFSAVDRDPETELRSEEKEIGFFQIFFDHVRVAADGFRILVRYDRRPRLAVIGGLENVRGHVAESVSIERGVSSAGVEVARLHPANPRILWKIRNVRDHVVPGLPGIARELKVSVIGSNPDQVLILWRFTDRVNRGVHLGG